eukprot:9492308-Pyramimonas_sp.AAC.1
MAPAATASTRPQLGLQNPCGGDCDECLALAGASLRPRWPAHARARSGQPGWRDRRGRVGADRWALSSGHFSASRRH